MCPTYVLELLQSEPPRLAPYLLAMAEIMEIQQEDEFFDMGWYDPNCYATEIIDAKYLC